jgi:hypothetical protein
LDATVGAFWCGFELALGCQLLNCWLLGRGSVLLSEVCSLGLEELCAKVTRSCIRVAALSGLTGIESAICAPWLKIVLHTEFSGECAREEVAGGMPGRGGLLYLAPI